MWTVEIGAVPGECMYEVTGWLTKHHDASTWPCKVETNLKNGFIERAVICMTKMVLRRLLI